METERIITWIMTIFCTGVAVGSFFHFWYIRLNWTRTTARVIGNIGKATSGGTAGGGRYQSSTSFAELEYTVRGETYQVQGDLGRKKGWDIGTRVPILYKPSNPNHHLSDNVWLQLIFSGGFAVFGVAGWLVLLGYLS